MRFRLWLEDDLENRLKQMAGGVRDDSDRQYDGYHPDFLLDKKASGYSFGFDPRFHKLILGHIGDTHNKIGANRGVTGRIRLPSSRDELQYFKTDVPLISFWSNQGGMIKQAIQAMQRDPALSAIPNFDQSFLVIGGYYRGRIGQFTGQDDSHELVTILGKQYTLIALPGLVHTLPPGPEKQAVIDYICQSTSPWLDNYKGMCQGGGKAIDIKQKFYATQGD